MIQVFDLNPNFEYMLKMSFNIYFIKNKKLN